MPMMTLEQCFENSMAEVKHHYGEDNIGDMLGSGLDGRVFEFGDKVIKFTRPWKNCNCKFELVRFLETAKEHLSPHLVKVFDYGRCKTGMYWYTMERLMGLNDDEQHDIDTIGNLLYQDDGSPLTLGCLRSLSGINSYLAGSSIHDPRCASLVLYLNTCGSGHGDFCSINVMKRAADSMLVAIDLESFIFSNDDYQGRQDCYKFGECFDEDDDDYYGEL